MKEKILEILSARLAGEQDNLARVEAMVRRWPDDWLDKEYGYSGKSLREILDEARERAGDAERCIEWVGLAEVPGDDMAASAGGWA